MSDLYFSSRELMQCIDQLLLEFPELSDDDELRLDTLEGATSLDEILAQVVDKAMQAKALAEAVKSRIADLNERRSRFLRQEQSMRNLVLRIMDRADITKVMLTEATLSVRAAQPKAIITDALVIPDQFMRLKKEPDMKPILDALKGGQHIEGAVLSNGSASLTIRIK